MAAIRSYEQVLSRELLRVLRDRRGQVYGLSDAAQVEERVPTVCFNLPGIAPAGRDRGCGSGRHRHPRRPHVCAASDAPPGTRRRATGAVRVSLVHYNTLAEIERFAAVLDRLRRTP